MSIVSWTRGAFAVGVLLALGGAVSADDTIRLDLKKSSASYDGSATSEFSHLGRATADDAALDDVNFRYSRGYSRGNYGSGYYSPRFYAFRSGYSHGFYGGYYGGYGYAYYPRYYGGYAFGYYPRYSYYYSPAYLYSPVQSYYYGGGSYCDYPISSASYSVPSIALSSPRQPMTEPEPPLAPRYGEPPAKDYPYDGPTAPRAKPPIYRYDGGPANPVPMPPEPTPKMKDPAPKLDPADGRVVAAPATKKYSYAAYGENRATGADRSTYVVKEKN